MLNRLTLMILSAAFLSSPAFAGVVGNGTPSSCTEAALAAQIPAGGTVTFNCGAGPQSIAMTFTLSFVPTNPKVTIDGNDTITLDGTGLTTGMVSVWGGDTAVADVTLRHITLANGNITTGLNAGGALQNFGKLTLDTVTFRNNQAAGSGAIFQELCTGCLNASLTATHCLFENNHSGRGGAISIQGGDATIEDSTFRSNSAGGGGAIEIYGNATFKIDMSINRCTFSGNTATSSGGAIVVESLNAGSMIRMANDTFSGNSVAATGQGAALYIDATPVTITNCTIAGNSAGTTGGAVHFGSRTPATAMNNTILAGNGGGNCSFDAGSILTGGHNLQFGDATCPGVSVANPLLSPLADNGGATQTMALAAGSPAIDAADSTAAPATDQRGLPRTDGNGDGVVAADIGAFEAPGPIVNPNRHRAVRP